MNLRNWFLRFSSTVQYWPSSVSFLICCRCSPGRASNTSMNLRNWFLRFSSTVQYWPSSVSFEFGSVHRALDEISQQHRSALQQIRKETLDGQYCTVEENLKNQFRKFMDVLEARPGEHQQRKKDDFEESYSN